MTTGYHASFEPAMRLALELAASQPDEDAACPGVPPDVPVGAVVLRPDGEVIGRGSNRREADRDPTAHAEIVAIREGAAKLQSEDFAGCEFYILAHPCPMCLAAMYYCSPERVVFITDREDYSRYYVDDRRYFTLANFYAEIGKPWNERRMPMVHEARPEGIEVYRRWKELNG